MTDMVEILKNASELGMNDGHIAAIHTEIDDASDILTRLNEGDPDVYDYLPFPDFSGQWADAMTESELYSHCGLDSMVESDPDILWSYETDVLTTYEDAYIEAMENTIKQRCALALS